LDAAADKRLPVLESQTKIHFPLGISICVENTFLKMPCGFHKASLLISE
jgi:hypothetical protein